METFSPEKHYQTICQWWEAQNWPKVPLEFLPSFGLVVYHGETPAVAGWLYRTDSAICWIEWIVANPEVRGEPRTEAINLLLSSLKEKAKECGGKIIFTTANNGSLVQRLEKNGYIVTDKDATHLICNMEGL